MGYHLIVNKINVEIKKYRLVLLYRLFGSISFVLIIIMGIILGSIATKLEIENKMYEYTKLSIICIAISVILFINFMISMMPFIFRRFSNFMTELIKENSISILLAEEISKIDGNWVSQKMLHSARKLEDSKFKEELLLVLKDKERYLFSIGLIPTIKSLRRLKHFMTQNKITKP